LPLVLAGIHSNTFDHIGQLIILTILGEVSAMVCQCLRDSTH